MEIPPVGVHEMHSDSSSSPLAQDGLQDRILVSLATYNELENLPSLVEEIQRFLPRAHILVVDDNSPDGTGRWAEERSRADDRVLCLHRKGKQGLGSAIVAAMRYAIEHEYEYLINLDADFSHPPRYLPNLRRGMQRGGQEEVDCMIGSRYVPGGGIEGWPLKRHFMSRGVNLYARLLLRLPTKDCSGSYRCYRVSTLAKLDFTTIRSRGYSFLEEVLWRLKRVGCRFGETPIVFVDRVQGESKIDMKEAIAALWIIFRLGVFDDGKR